MLSDARRRLSRFLHAQELLPVYGFVPDDANELPCIVVGPGSLADAETGVYDIDLSVYVLGRRLSDEQAQVELDDLADKVIIALGGTRGRDSFAVTRSTPQIVTVGGTDIPSHNLTVETSVANC